jgi:hypothetical protein
VLELTELLQIYGVPKSSAIGATVSSIPHSTLVRAVLRTRGDVFAGHPTVGMGVSELKARMSLLGDILTGVPKRVVLPRKRTLKKAV